MIGESEVTRSRVLVSRTYDNRNSAVITLGQSDRRECELAHSEFTQLGTGRPFAHQSGQRM